MAPRQKKLIVKLHVSPKALRALSPPEILEPSEQPSSPAASSNPEVSGVPSPSDVVAASHNATPIPNDPSAAATPAGASESTPAPSSLQVPTTGARRGGKPGPKPGTKRGQAALDNGLPKPRGKPGPKKKPRPGDTNTDPSQPFSTVPPIAMPKLGPKANMGAINAGLRALDRTGKPTRKWTKQPLSLKSFTGVQWSINTWRAPKKPAAVDASGMGTEVKTEAGASENGRRGSEMGDVSMDDAISANGSVSPTSAIPGDDTTSTRSSSTPQEHLTGALGESDEAESQHSSRQDSVASIKQEKLDDWS